MSLPTRQQRALDQIEKTFQARDPRLTSLFATFGRLTSQEAMPAFEEITSRLSRILQPVLLIPMVAVIMVTSIVLGSLAPGPRCSTTQAARGIAHGQLVPRSTGGCPSTAGQSPAQNRP
jgi:Protein of unknown function (DUF3040)